MATIAPRISDAILEALSLTDYGGCADEHLCALHAIRDNRRAPSPMEWVPREVISLGHYFAAQDEGEAGQLKRAFCCAALLQSAAGPRGWQWGENYAVIGAIVTAHALGGSLLEAVAQFLTWRYPQKTIDPDERPFFAFGLVSAALLQSPVELSSIAIDEAVAFVEDAELTVRDPTGSARRDWFDGSFLELTCFEQQHHEWRDLASSLQWRFPDHPRLVEFTRRISETSGDPDARRSL